MIALMESLGTVAGAWAPFAGAVALKGAGILLAAYGVTLALGRASASLRHHVWTLAFASVVALPFLSGTLPAWEVSVPGWEAPAGSVVAADRAAAPARPEGRSALEGPVGADADPFTAEPGAEGVAAGAHGAAVGAGSEAGAEGRAPAEDGMAGLLPGVRGVATLLIIVWLLGVFLLLAHLVMGILSARWTSRRASPVDDPEWRALVAGLKEELGVRSEVRLRHSPRIGTPMTWGTVRPVLLLPDEALDWPAERRRAVVLHELAHVRRRDCLVHLLAQVARAIHWINPLAWVGASRLRRERERACDDLVLKAGTSGPDYAELLLDVARSRNERRLAWGGVSMARPSQLEGRLLAILDPARDRRGVSPMVSVVACVVAAATAVPLAAFQASPSSARGAEADPVVETTRVGIPESGTETSTAPVPLSSWQEVPAEQASPPADSTEERLVALLARKLQDERAEMRSQAAHTLGSMESTLGVAPLTGALRDESVEVRKQVAWALGMIESGEAVEGLVRVLREDASVEVREQAAWALGMIEDPAAVDGLAAVIRDDDGRVREQAVWALGMIESSDGVTPLLGVLRDEEVELRKQAAWALGMIESSDAVEDLTRILREDASAEVREQAAWALGMIEDPAATEALIDAVEDESGEVAEQAMWALGQIVG